MSKDKPIISIGMPVYNGEKYIRNAIESLLSQSLSDFELIISDNASTDNTGNICIEYAEKDKRIIYVRQQANIGPYPNFKYVLDTARSEYFMWAACDDRRSKDFLELNYEFLSNNNEYVASTSPSGYEGSSVDKEKFINFAIDANDIYQRYHQFFDNCWVSHGIFYSLIRTNDLRGCTLIGKPSFIAYDWAVNLYLASLGKIHRTKGGYTIFGVNGVSNGADAYKAFRNNIIELLIPFYRLSKYVLYLSAGFNIKEKIKIVLILIKLNVNANFKQVWMRLYPIYFKYIRPIVRKNQRVK